MLRIRGQLPPIPLGFLLQAAGFQLIQSKLPLAQEASPDQNLLFRQEGNLNYTKHKIWIKSKKLTNLISKIMTKIYLNTKMIPSEFHKTKTNVKKWKICMCPKVTYHLEKINRHPAKEAKMERIPAPQLQPSWVRLFKNNVSSTIKNSKDFKTDLKLIFLRTPHKKMMISNKVKKI